MEIAMKRLATLCAVVCALFGLAKQFPDKLKG